jgi:hypothetical protein
MTLKPQSSVFRLLHLAAAFAAMGLPASVAAAQTPQLTPDAAPAQQPFPASPAFAQLVTGKSIVLVTRDDEFVLVAIAAGAGSGIGAHVGAESNARNHRDDVIYDTGLHTKTIAVAPILSPTRMGVAVSMSWC